ncbi:FAD-dependent oxidoreductase [Arthrobacter alpinus]|nr:FAD-dependent oxidoreductase [Arthrobacter alpinus]
MDRQTLDSWLVSHTEDSLARRFFRILVPALFSAESPELSLLHFLFYAKSGTSLDSLMNTTGGAQERRVVGGTHLISERMATALGDAIRLNSVVRTIHQDGTGVVIKFHIGYDTPFWRDDGLNGSVWSFDDAFNVVLDNSPNDGSCGVLVGFLEGSHARTPV